MPRAVASGLVVAAVAATLTALPVSYAITYPNSPFSIADADLPATAYAAGYYVSITRLWYVGSFLAGAYRAARLRHVEWLRPSLFVGVLGFAGLLALTHFRYGGVSLHSLTTPSLVLPAALAGGVLARRRAV